MSSLNPYEKFLDGRPMETILAATAGELGKLLDAIGPRKAATPLAPGKWSPAEIVCHLADCELVHGFRLRQTLAEDTPTVHPFDQDKWATQYNGIPASLALEAFAALRSWNLALIKGAPPAAANRKMTHPERGTLTFQSLIETMAGHDLNHLKQLLKAASD
jgi:hypothetical protein